MNYSLFFLWAILLGLYLFRLFLGFFGLCCFWLNHLYRFIFNGFIFSWLILLVDLLWLCFRWLIFGRLIFWLGHHHGCWVGGLGIILCGGRWEANRASEVLFTLVKEEVCSEFLVLIACHVRLCGHMHGESE